MEGNMAEIDIDKMLAQREKMEKNKKAKSNTVLIAGISGVIIIAGLIITAVIFLTLGEKSIAYFPLHTGGNVTYNIKGRNPETWEFLDKQENVMGEDCYIMNKVDKGTNLSVQEFYCYRKEGLKKMAQAANFGEKKNYDMIMLPYRLKPGKTFVAAQTLNGPINAVIEAKETVSTTVGEVEAYRVFYKGGKATDRTVWYGKNIGVIKVADRGQAEELDIISMEK
jgi:hypothetical protein